jgi:hypothetical protein
LAAKVVAFAMPELSKKENILQLYFLQIPEINGK